MHVKGKIVADLARVKKFHQGLPFLCWVIDLYRNPTNKAKMVSFCCAFVDPDCGRMVNYGLGLLDCNPSYEEKKDNKASNLLFNFLKIVMMEYNICPKDGLTSSVDASPDVCKASKMLTTMSEWCLTHMLNQVMVQSSGTTERSADSEFKECGDLVIKARKVAETLNKSGKLQKYFQDLVIEVTGRKVTNLRNALSHRWSFVIDVLHDLIIYKLLLKMTFTNKICNYWRVIFNYLWC